MLSQLNFSLRAAYRDAVWFSVGPEDMEEDLDEVLFSLLPYHSVS